MLASIRSMTQVNGKVDCHKFGLNGTSKFASQSTLSAMSVQTKPKSRTRPPPSAVEAHVIMTLGATTVPPKYLAKGGPNLLRSSVPICNNKPWDPKRVDETPNAGASLLVGRAVKSDTWEKVCKNH